MASIYRRKPGGCYYVTYQIRPGKRRTVKGCKDKVATEALARKLETDAMLRREGVIDPKAEKLAANGFMPLEAHIKAFETALRAKDNTEEHVRRTLSFIRGMAEACGFEHLADLDAAKVAAHVGHLKRQGMGARSINARLTAFKSLTAWLTRTERLRTDPMKQVAKLNTRTDRRRQRRPLSDEELARLIHAAENGPVVKGMAGPDRATLYRLAVETGLRANELRSLSPGSFDLRDTRAATVTVEAAYSKRRREDILPLRPDLARAMAAYVANRPTRGQLLAVPRKSADMLRADLRRARAWWIQETLDRAERRQRRRSDFLATRDASNRVVDFHALRHTFITRLARSGVAPAVAKSLARHSTITLTMDHYTHTFIEDERSALAQLPGLGAKGLQGKSVRATGTHAALSRAHPAPEAATSA